MSGKKNLYIKTYGCQMNVYDSQKITELLGVHGFEITNEMADADLLILMTCHIREKATEKVYSELGRIKPFKDARKKQGDDMLICIAGCVAQAEGEEIFKRTPYVDMVVGPQSYHTLPQMLEEVKRGQKWQLNLEFTEEVKFDNIKDIEKPQGSSAFVSIQEGCDKFCHFCVVPYTRGAEFSRPVNAIYRESMNVVTLGAKEITLLGQNVNAYHGEVEGLEKSSSLGELVEHLSSINGLERIRYTTSHPIDVDESLIQAHKNLPKLMPFLHLPVQSGSNKILKSMNRRHTREEYFDIIDKFREACPDIAFSSDFIVGYPGETDQDFEDTMDLVRKVNYAQCFSFKYSPRPGTPAASIATQVPEDVKSERLYLLQNLLNEQQEAFNKSCVGKSLKVLFTEKGKKDGQIVGKSPYMQSVIVEGCESIIGKIEEVKITEHTKNILKGRLTATN